MSNSKWAGNLASNWVTTTSERIDFHKRYAGSTLCGTLIRTVTSPSTEIPGSIFEAALILDWVNTELKTLHSARFVCAVHNLAAAIDSKLIEKIGVNPAGSTEPYFCTGEFSSSENGYGMQLVEYVADHYFNGVHKVPEDVKQALMERPAPIEVAKASLAARTALLRRHSLKYVETQDEASILAQYEQDPEAAKEIRKKAGDIMQGVEARIEESVTLIMQHTKQQLQAQRSC